MTRVETVKEEEGQKLSPDEFAELRNWTLERDWEQWDLQIERDAEEGRLEPLSERALEAHRQGKSREM